MLRTRLRATILVLLVLALTVPSGAFGAPLSSSFSVVFTDANNGLMSGSRTDGLGFISRTTDGGVTWVATVTPSPRVKVDAVTASSGWAVSQWADNPWQTTNGISWPTVPALSSWLHNAYDVRQIDPTTAVVVGVRTDVRYGRLASIWRTADNGISWTTVNEGPVYPYDAANDVWPQTDARFEAVDSDPSGRYLYAAMNEYQPAASTVLERRLMFRSSDWGSTWTTETLPAVGTLPLEDVAVGDANVAWAVAGQNAYKTTAPNAWTGQLFGAFQIIKVTNYTLDANAVAIDPSDPGHVLIAGDSNGVPMVIRTRDGGTSWTYYRGGSSKFQDVTFVSPTKAVAVGDDNAVVFLTLSADGTIVAQAPILATNGNHDGKLQPTVSLAVPASSSYASAKLSGSLKYGATGLAGKPVQIQQYSGGVWSTIATATTVAGGTFGYTAKPTTRISYRAVFAGDAAYRSHTSISGTVKPGAYLTGPYAPTTARRNTSFTSYGYLKPQHSSGTYAVRIYLYRYVNGSYRYYKYVNAKASGYSSYTKYAASVKLPYAGKWRMRAYHYDSGHAATWTSYRYVTVK